MKISFYCHIDKPELLEIIDFYHQDIKILKEIDPDLKIATKIKDIDWDADIIFIWWWTYAFYPTVLAKIKGKKVVITGTFNYRCPGIERDYFKRPLWQRCLIKFPTKIADKNILVSKNELKEISSDWKFNNFEYSPHCVDTTKYYPIPGKERSEFFFTICGLDKASIVRKCLKETIDAVKILKNENISVKFFIAGRRGNAYGDIKQYIEAMDLSDCVTLLGEISENEKITCLQECKCYIQPSKYEGFGLAIAEAMSCGCNIITSAVGEVPNVVGDTGLILDKTTPLTIAQAMKSVIGRQSNNAQTRERIEKLFPIQRRRKDLHRILNNIM